MIRPATLDDVPAMVAICERFHAASYYGRYGVRYSAEKMAMTLQDQIEAENCCVLVAERDGALVGLAGAVATELYMSYDRVAAELYWWVEPQARGGPAAIRFIERIEDWAREQGCCAVSMSSLGQIEGSPADAIFTRRGYDNIEKSWIKRI